MGFYTLLSTWICTCALNIYNTKVKRMRVLKALQVTCKSLRVIAQLCKQYLSDLNGVKCSIGGRLRMFSALDWKACE